MSNEILAKEAFNAVFTAGQGDKLGPKVGWAEIEAKVLSAKGKCELIKTSGMTHPLSPILPAGIYQEILVTVYWGKHLNYKLGKYKAVEDLSLYKIFKAIRDNGPENEKTRRDEAQKEGKKTMEIDGFIVTMEQPGKYSIVSKSGEAKDPESPHGRQLINKFFKALI